MKYLLLLTFLFFSICDSQSQVTEEDSLILVNFYHDLDGDNWATNTNWLSNEPVNEWFGITTKNNRVSSIVFSENNLNGSIPSYLGDLDSLTQLYISVEENLSGTLPPELSNCSILNQLDISVTSISGEIPSSFSNLHKLTSCYLFRNNLEGNFPSFLLDLPLLEQLDISDNNFTGTIPTDISKLNKITYLSLARNNFSGQVPPNVSQLTELAEFHLRENNLEGDVELWLNNLPSLYYLTIGSNEFTGKIKASMFNPEPLVYLDFNATNIDYIENLEELTSIQRISCGDTKLNYSDLDRHESIIHLFNLYDFKKRLSRDSITLEENQELIILSDIDGQNTYYKWYKNNVEIPDATSENLIIPSLSKEDEGWYYGEGLNYGIAIKREPIHLTVENSTATEDLHELKVKLFPNPTSNMLFIEGIDIQLDYIIYSSTGRLITKGKTINHQIDIDGLLYGHYVLKLLSNDKEKVSHIIKL